MKIKRNPVIVVQGGQWGSEAKGNIAAYLCVQRNVHWAVRTGAINAGHTVVFEGNRYAMQQLPTGWVNPYTILVIGVGAYIHPETLWREVDEINRAIPQQDVRKRLVIDYRCGLHSSEAEARSKEANRHHRMGATGKGCSEAIVAKIRDRNDGYELFLESKQGRAFRERNPDVQFLDTVHLLNNQIDKGDTVLIEGTQGTMLDLHIGPYPFTTSRMTSAANWVAECGLAPGLEYETVLVCRTYPIRVAGNSGPMKGEIEWTDLARGINSDLAAAGEGPLVANSAIQEFEIQLAVAACEASTAEKYTLPMLGPLSHIHNTRLSSWTAQERDQFRVAASELHRDALLRCSPEVVTELRKLFEMTTVTKKLRRIARFSAADVRYAIEINRPKWIALTFLDYQEPLLRNATVGYFRESFTKVGEMTKEWSDAYIRVKALASDLGVPIRLISTGPSLDNCIPVKMEEFNADHQPAV